jgi:Protein of unknown function (DUF3007)
VLVVVYISPVRIGYCVQNMTYVSQLKDYEDAVMKKRLDEMTEEELERMLEETEQQRQQRLQDRRQ